MTTKADRLTNATLTLDRLLRSNGIRIDEWKTLGDIAAEVIEAGATTVSPEPPERVDIPLFALALGDMVWVEKDQMFARVSTRPRYNASLNVWEWFDEKGVNWQLPPSRKVTVALHRAQGVEWNADVNLGAVVPFKALTPGYGDDAA